MEGVEIRGGAGEVLDVHLRDVLSAIGSYVADWDWSLLHLWAVGELPGERSVMDYEALAEVSLRTGARITEDDMVVLSCADQIIDAVFVGNAMRRDVWRRSADFELYRDNELVMEVDDATLWRVVSHRPEIVEALQKRFPEAKPILGLQ